MADQKQAPIDEAQIAGEFEIVDFLKGEHGKGSWLNHALLEGTAREVLERVTSDPLWDSERMKIAIYLNSERIIHKDFEQLISYFSDRVVKQKLRAVDFDNFEHAVQTAAKGLLARSADSMQEKFYDLQTQLTQLTELTSSMVEREYSVPFKYQITEKMASAGLTALGRHFEPKAEYDFVGNEVEGTAPDFHGKAVEEVYKAMVMAREEPDYKVKLPRPYQTGDEYTVFEIATRRKMLDEVEESLRQQGIVFEPMQTRFEQMGAK